MLHADRSTHIESHPQPGAARIESASPWGARLREGIAAVAWMGPPLALAATVRVALFLVADVGARMLAPQPFSDSLTNWQQMDAVWYTRIAASGYSYTSGHASTVNFFPLYPLTVRLVQPLVAWVPGTDTYVLAGMLVSWSAFAAACMLLYRLTRDRFGQTTAHGAVLLMATFPFSFYFGAVFAESLYLALVLATFLSIEHRRWWVAGVAAMLAGAARPPGLVVGACVALAYAMDWARSRHPLRRDVLALALTPLGAAAYAAYCWVRFDDPLAYAKASWDGWHGGRLQDGGLLAVWENLLQPDRWLRGFDFPAILHGIYALLFLLFLASLIPIWRKLGASYALFAFASVIAPVVTFPTVSSLGRYLSVVFPAFIVVAYGLRRWFAVREGVVITSAAFLGIFTVMFVCGYGLP